MFLLCVYVCFVLNEYEVFYVVESIFEDFLLFLGMSGEVGAGVGAADFAPLRTQLALPFVELEVELFGPVLFGLDLGLAAILALQELLERLRLALVLLLVRVALGQAQVFEQLFALLLQVAYQLAII